MSSVRNAFNCSFVACRSNLRKCWHFILCYKPQSLQSKNNEYHVLCLGLSGSGKSTLLAQLVGEQTDNIKPTNGFNIKTLPLNGIILSIKELGGSERLQTFWSEYYENKQAILFLINIAANDLIMEKSLQTLRNILSNNSNNNNNNNNASSNTSKNNQQINLRNRPLMIIGTHKDDSNARTEQQIQQSIQPLLIGYKWKLYLCSSFDRHAIMDAIDTLILLIKNVFP